MGVKWRDFQMPKRLDCEENSYTNTYGKFVAEPFERGYGVTLGNSLRRILLSSIEGSAVTSIRIEGVSVGVLRGGKLVKKFRKLKVKALPEHLPEETKQISKP